MYLIAVIAPVVVLLQYDSSLMLMS